MVGLVSVCYVDIDFLELVKLNVFDDWEYGDFGEFCKF